MEQKNRGVLQKRPGKIGSEHDGIYYLTKIYLTKIYSTKYSTKFYLPGFTTYAEYVLLCNLTNV